MISGCASDPKIIVVEERPVAYPSEVAIAPFPVKPPVGERTNGNMHNYRKRVEEWGCDTLMLFGGYVKRVADHDIMVPKECVTIIKGERNYYKPQ